VKNYLPAKLSTRGARTHPKAAEGICVISIVFNIAIDIYDSIWPLCTNAW
jgi:hypothetical protein